MENVNQDFNFCQNCQVTVVVVDGFYCHMCGEMMCAVCGCTDSEPCLELCGWIRAGLCSSCAEKPETADDEEEEAAKSLDWNQAFVYFSNVRKNYQELAGTPGVNTSLALEHVFRPIAERYERGERTVELFLAMASVE